MSSKLNDDYEIFSNLYKIAYGELFEEYEYFTMSKEFSFCPICEYQTKYGQTCLFCDWNIVDEFNKNPTLKDSFINYCKTYENIIGKKITLGKPIKRSDYENNNDTRT